MPLRFLATHFLISLTSATVVAAQVVSFFPQGSVKQVQQVTVKFSADMVPLGDPRAKNDPFAVTCNVATLKIQSDGTPTVGKVETPKFTTKWIDTKNWSLDLEQPLKSGVRCTFTIKADAKDLANASVQGSESYTFSTSGPALLGVAPVYGNIEPDQYFVALTDGPIDTKSLEKTAYFEVQNIPDKVGIKVIQGKNRDLVLPAAIKDNWRWRQYNKMIQEHGTKPISEIKELGNFLVLAATRRFPEEAKVVLHWPEGILSTSGLPVTEAQDFEFKVIVPFQAQFTCERATPNRSCNPILDMRLSFTQRIARRLLTGAKLVASDGKTWTPIELKKGDQNKNQSGIMSTGTKSGVGITLISKFEDEKIDALTFKPPFPESTKFKIILPGKLKDELGRDLSNQNKYPLAVATDEYSPLIKFPASFGILELKADALLPVSVRNVEKQVSIKQVAVEGKTLNLSNQNSLYEILNWYRKVQKKAYSWENRGSPLLPDDQGTKFQLPKPGGEREFELVGVPLKKPGFYVVEMASPRLGEFLLGGGSPMYVSTGALVTDMAVHMKVGRESSAIWVTQLSTGKPVGGAKVTLVDAFGKPLVNGTTNSSGLFHYPELKEKCSENGRDGEEYVDRCEVFAFAQKGDDMSFASSRWSQGIESYRFNFPREYLSTQWGPVVMHTVLDRMVAQPGDVIQMKHILRERRSTGFSMVDTAHMPKRVLVVHQGSNKTYTLPFEFDKATGSAIGKFSIPKEATLGRYAIYLSNKNELQKKETEENDPFDWTAQATGSFIVSEYRLPLMKATLKIQGDHLVRPTDVKADLSASYLSGGPAKGLKVKLRTSLERGYFTPNVPESSSYNFFAEPMKAGLGANENRPEQNESYLKVQDLTLSSDGGLLARASELPRSSNIQNLVFEMEYTDPNGEVKTATAQTPIFPSDAIVGLRADSWYNKPGKTKVQGIVTDARGKPKAKHNYTVEAFQSNYITHRKRLIGGFYSYDSKTEIVALGKVCEGTTDDLGRFSCEPKSLPPGQIHLQAKTSDDKGNPTFATTSVSIFQDSAESWWVPSDSDRIDVIPEKNKYEPSEKAKLVVRSPYPIATALVTVEREGVLESFVTELRRDNPTIEVPLKGHYAPNVFVSVMVVRGRVGDPQPTALIDLARPAMKMGIAEIKVGWKANELLVDVKADKTKYRARDNAEVSIQVKTASSANLPAGSEVAVAAVDEALMRLKENSSWKILDEMMGNRPLAVDTSSGQNQVIGRRHFGSKAKPPGGGGAGVSIDPRDLFEPVLYWNPRVKLDSSGRAKVTVPLNDSMTSFRIVAVATGGENFFGDGSTTIESSKDLILYSGFAPLVREGDQIRNALTIRNTTVKAMKVNLEIKSKDVKVAPKLSPVELKPSEARTIDISTLIPTDLKNITWQIQAKDELSGATDVLTTKVKVEPAVPPHVLQATLFQLDKTNQVANQVLVKQPFDAIPGRGGIGVHARSTLASGLAGVKSYMEDYSYSCLEQKVSKAIVLEDKAATQQLIEALPTYFDGYGLLKFFPSSLCGSAQLSRYVVNIMDDNGYKIPENTRLQVAQGLLRFLNGTSVCYSWWDSYVRSPYTNESKLLAIETLSRLKSFSPTLISTIQITPNIWKTETVAAWFQLLKRQSDIPNRDVLINQAENILRARVNMQGSLMNLQGDLDWEGQWQLFTSRDQEALGVFGIAVSEGTWKEDIGRMARGVVARLKLGKWDTTMANAWGVTQMRKFSQKFESEKVSGETKVATPDISRVFKWQANPNGEKQFLPWPKGSEKTSVPIQFQHAGSGKPWIHLETSAAIPLKNPFDMGYKVARKILPVSQATPGKWTKGDVANIELTITAKTDQPWVVVRDPIPAGASHLGTGLDGSSRLLDRPSPKKSTEQNTVAGTVQPWPVEYDEKSNSYFISYAAYLPRGSYTLSYRVRLNSSGDFKLPPSRAEAMYSPEAFGESPNANWKVE